MSPDKDGDSVKAGEEDKNRNGRVDRGETDQNVKEQGAFYYIPSQTGGEAVIYLD